MKEIEKNWQISTIKHHTTTIRTNQRTKISAFGLMNRFDKLIVSLEIGNGVPFKMNQKICGGMDHMVVL